MKRILKAGVIFIVLLLILIVLLIFYLSSKETPIVVIAPNGGENLQLDRGFKIEWRQQGLEEKYVAIWLEGYDSEENPVPKAYQIANGVPAGQQQYLWEVPLDISEYFQAVPDKYKIEITESGEPVLYDESDDYFNISSESL